MWKLIDKTYRIIFRHSAVIGILLLSCAVYYILMPGCDFSERARVSRIQADFRALRIQFDSASTGAFTPITLPMDLYGNDNSYRLIITSRTLMATSAGPDKIYGDDLVEYDPTNGTVSHGDILTTIATGLKYQSF